MKPLLFISPTTPLPGGHGLGMRAFAVLRALSRRHRVSLLVLNAPHGGEAARNALAELCEECAFQPAGLWKGRKNVLRALAARIPALHSRLFPLPREWAQIARTPLRSPFARRKFETVHVFRTYMIPVLERLQAGVSWERTQLDVDDLESATRRSLAAMHRLNGNLGEAARLELEADGYEILERRHFPGFDRIFASSERDRAMFVQSGLHPAPEVLPNIAAPAAVPSAEPHEGMRLLFVGSLGYAPNADAVLHFCREILPRIKRLTPAPVTFDVVGAGMPPAAAAGAAACPGVKLHGYVEDLSPFYGRTDMVVAPLRGGGGTRIKILEAFAHARPVVATPQGIEGIEARDGVHALVEDDAEAFADACIRLRENPGLGAELSANAARLVRERHSQAVLEALFRKG